MKYSTIKEKKMNTAAIFENLHRMAEIKDSLPWQLYSADERRNVEIVRLYDTRKEVPDGPAAALLKYKPGARVSCHLHPGFELIYVLDGVLCNDTGSHGIGCLEICPPGSTHELWSDEGAIFLVIWEQPVAVLNSSTVQRVLAVA